MGRSPTLPAPTAALIPTVHIAPAQGWPAGTQPTPMAGLRVTALATGLDHPRWLLVLPNGDVLVAESNAPPRAEARTGIRDRLKALVMQRAGAGTPSANRISLLRDADGDGVAETRSVLLSGLHSPFGMALIGDRLFVANADAVLAFPYRRGDTVITAPGTKLLDLPGGMLQAAFADGMFIGQHGSWNRRPHSGCKVIFVPFQGGRPTGAPSDVLSGFLSQAREAMGRAVGVALENGAEFYARTVASSLDPKRTFLQLLDPRHLPADFADD